MVIINARAMIIIRLWHCSVLSTWNQSKNGLSI